MQKKYSLDDWIKALTPGIQTYKEKKEFPNLPSHEDQLTNEQLFYRSLSK